ncbi:MAG TPA: sugar ABC transporter substrate-binding protein [Chloroflexota bacterium]
MTRRRSPRATVVLTGVLVAVLLTGGLPAGVAAQTAPDVAAACAQTNASGAMQMWERTGGNKQMVDLLACSWNAANPTRPINLTYIEHDAMVPKLAQAIASNTAPDLLGMDLIYGPQFETAGQLYDVTDMIGNDPSLATASPGHMKVSTYQDRLYGVPLYADVSVLFWNKALFRQAGLDPERPPTNMQEIHDMASKISALGNGVYGFYLPGNCAGCNIFTVGPYIWASGGKIEPATCGDEPLVGDNIKTVLTQLRSMQQQGLIDPAAQSENGDTFAEVFGSGKVGIMGTGNFNVVLAKQQNPGIDIGVTLIPGLDSGQVASFAGGDIVAIPKTSKRVNDAVDFERYILSPDVQVNVYSKAGNLTTRSDMADNPISRQDPFNADLAKAIPVSQTPYTPRFFELINSPQGPWLQMLQRVYYTNDDLDQVISDAKQQMKDISCQ